jgi:hypothetical protein
MYLGTSFFEAYIGIGVMGLRHFVGNVVDYPKAVRRNAAAGVTS